EAVVTADHKIGGRARAHWHFAVFPTGGCEPVDTIPLGPAHRQGHLPPVPAPGGAAIMPGIGGPLPGNPAMDEQTSGQTLRPKYPRVVLKLSGEAFGHSGKSGISIDETLTIARQAKRVLES